MDKCTEGHSIAPRTGEIVDHNAVRLDLALQPFDQRTMVPQCVQTYTYSQRKNMIVCKESSHLRKIMQAVSV